MTDRRKMQLVFKACFIEMQDTILADFRLSKVSKTITLLYCMNNNLK